MRDDVMWTAAAPLWATSGTETAERPEILRFAGDDFMDQLEATLAEDPRSLDAFVARNETWRVPAAGPDGSSDDVTKLFQPTHDRYYLVAASLVCSRYWLPDKKVDTKQGESAFFVLRRLTPVDAAAPVDATDPSTYVESAWIEGEAAHWDEAPVSGVASGERRLPMFPLRYQDERSERRVFAGFIPVSGREALEAAPPALPADVPSSDPMASLTDTRLGPLAAVVEGLQALLDALAGTVAPLTEEAQESLFFALLDLADWLKVNVPAVWAGTTTSGTAQRTLSDLLGNVHGFQFPTSWMDALKQADAAGPTAARDGSPAPVAGMDGAEIAAAVAGLGVEAADLAAAAETSFFTAASAALLEVPAAEPAAGDETEAQPPEVEGSGAADGGVYVIRCAYERPHCHESHRMRVSGASRPVTLAHFYDPDAPFRRARIPTPFDTSLEGLRKFPKNVSVTISKALRAQIERMQGATVSDLEDGNLKDASGISFGMICQLSIPIITICALILLMIIVSLLNIVFWWIPLFKICLPTVEAE